MSIEPANTKTIDEKIRKQIARLNRQRRSKAHRALSSYVCTARIRNTPEWMQGLAARITNVMHANGEPLTCVFDGDGFTFGATNLGCRS